MHKLERTKNTKKNVIYGLVNKCVTLFFPFLLRILIIQKLGAEYLGLSSLFTSILQVLSLTELGFSTAVVYCMYKPIADNDFDSLSAIILFFKKIYFFMGLIILCLGACLLPVLPRFIKDDVPNNINIYILYIAYLVNTSVSYLLFAYKSSLLSAYQRNDVVSNINTCTQLFIFIFQIVAIVILKNYYYYTVAFLLGTILNNFIINICVKKLYPKIKPNGEISEETKREIFTKVKGLIIDKLCGTSRNAFDSIFLSSFLGLVITAKYNNYYYIMNSVISILIIFTSSILAGIGNSIQTETKDKNYADMKKINFIYMILVGVCTVCLLCLYQPFSILFFGNDMIFDIKIVILFCIYFYVFEMGDIRAVYSSAAGLWWENRYRVIIEVILNILLDYVLGKLWGIYGIVITTIFTLFFINYFWANKILFKTYFNGYSLSFFYKNAIVNLIITLFCCILCFYICSFFKNNIVFLFVRLIICVSISLSVYFICYRKTDIYKQSLKLLSNLKR